MVYDPIGSTYGLVEKTRRAFTRSRAYGSSIYDPVGSRRLVEFDPLQLHVSYGKGSLPACPAIGGTADPPLAEIPFSSTKSYCPRCKTDLISASLKPLVISCAQFK